MAKLPFPGILTEQERINLETLQAKDIVRYEYFKFDISIIDKPKLIFKIPKGGILHVRVIGNVIQPFESTGFLNFYILDELHEFYNMSNTAVHIPGPFNAAWLSNYYMTIFKKLTPIYMVIKLTTESNVGSGYGVIQWLNLGNIPSYRRNK